MIRSCPSPTAVFLVTLLLAPAARGQADGHPDYLPARMALEYLDAEVGKPL